MRAFLLNHWFINNNKLSISLMCFYVDIEVLVEEGKLLYKLELYDSNKVALSFTFETLEDAIIFVDDVINNNYSINLLDIKRTYDEQYGKSKIIIKKE